MDGERTAVDDSILKAWDRDVARAERKAERLNALLRIGHFHKYPEVKPRHGAEVYVIYNSHGSHYITSRAVLFEDEHFETFTDEADIVAWIGEESVSNLLTKIYERQFADG